MMKPALQFTTHARRTSRQGFTLLELLVVIGIIAILSGVMFPAAHAVMKHVKKTKTETAATNIRNAIQSYLTEYRKLPYHYSEHEGAEVHLQTDNDLMNILCGMEAEAGEGGLNPARNVYYSGRNARPLGEGRYRSGVRIDAGGDAFLYDSWGEYYQVILDGDANGRVTKPFWDNDTASHEITSSILVWSKGPDKKTEEGEDNIKVW